MTSPYRIKAVTTPLPLLVLILALTVPYHMYVVDAITVPTLLGGIVSRMLPLWASGWPWYTQSAFSASPRYLSMDTILSMLSILYVLLLHTGAGMHESREKDIRGSQPPRQKAPWPH